MTRKRQSGFAIVSAIFILVVLAALGGFIATVATTQHVGSALDVMGARAYQAARSGTEWGLYQAVKASSCVASTDIGVVGGVAVTVSCSVIAAGDAVELGLGSIYSIKAVACTSPTGTTCPGAAATTNYVERSLTVLVEK
jgi:MSHA biogenesis protein MshP